MYTDYLSLYQDFKDAGDRSFCTALAYCLVTGANMHVANARLRRKRGRGVSGLLLNEAIQDAGYHMLEVKVKGYVENLPKKGLTSGTYLVYSSRHVSVIKDGVVLDWTALKEARSKRTVVCYQLLKTGESL